MDTWVDESLRCELPSVIAQATGGLDPPFFAVGSQRSGLLNMPTCSFAVNCQVNLLLAIPYNFNRFLPEMDRNERTSIC